MEEQLPPQEATDHMEDPGHPIQLDDPTQRALALSANTNTSTTADSTQDAPILQAGLPAALAAADDGPGGNEPYKGMLWIKDKFEEYRVQTDERMGALRMELDRRGTTIEMLNEELTQAREKIAHLSTKLEKNMSLLMNIHKELDRTLVTDQTAAAIPDRPAVTAADTPPATPEAAHGGSGDQAGNV